MKNRIAYKLNDNYLATCTIFGKGKMVNKEKSFTLANSNKKTVDLDGLDIEM